MNSNAGQITGTPSSTGEGQSVPGNTTEQVDNAEQSITDVPSSSTELVATVSSEIDYSKEFVVVNTQLDAINSCLVLLAVMVAMCFGSLVVKFFFDRIKG